METLQRPLTERDLKSLRVFCAVAQVGGFSAAERELNMSKASISCHIREIEQQLGVRLCERGPAGFRLTTAGGVALDVSRSEEHTSELQSLMRISYAVFCLKKKKSTTRSSMTNTRNRAKVQ